MSDNKPSKETLENWHQDPNNWKWGVFYFNKDDRRIFPPKKNKYMGWTVNFANPMSILMLFAIIILIRIVVNFIIQCSNN